MACVKDFDSDCLSSILRTSCTMGVDVPGARNESRKSLAAIIDSNIKNHIGQCARDGKFAKYYVLVGPHDGVDEEGDCEGPVSETKAHYIFNAYDHLHALYVVIRDSAHDAMGMRNQVPPGAYAYPVTSFLDDLLDRGADFASAMDVFRTYEIAPYEILPYDNHEIVEIASKS